jgi:hypothetical protein
MKIFFKPTKQKIILAIFLAIVFFIIFEIWTMSYLYKGDYADIYRGFHLPCISKTLPFMTPNASLLYEWQKARPHYCQLESELQEMFWKTKQYLLQLINVVIPSYVTACVILSSKKKGQKKPS